MPFDLRPVTEADAAAASAVVHASFLALAAADWEPSAREVFLAESSPDALAERLRSPAFAAAAFDASQMVGFALMPAPALLGMLFVHPAWQRRGIAKALWEWARTLVEATFADVKTIELNATPNAVDFYRSLGFVALAPEFTVQGCRATRMACWLPARGLQAKRDASPSSSRMRSDPQAVVQRQLDAYNARDLQRFLAEYSDDVRAYRPPAVEPALVGKPALAEFYATQRFNRPALHAALLNRMVLGRKVIDHERISGLRERPFEAAVVYEVVDGLIRCSWSYLAE
jgi:GNAT superfamily N-acetyltransferase